MKELIKWLGIAVLMFGIQSVKAENSELSIECSWGRLSATLAVPEGGSNTVVVKGLYDAMQQAYEQAVLFSETENPIFR